jgi:capsular polysaccharide transport system permease protein
MREQSVEQRSAGLAMGEAGERGGGQLVRSAGKALAERWSSPPFEPPLELDGAASRRAWIARPRLLSLLAVVVLPTLLAGLYLSLWTSNRYVSEFRVAVRTVQPLRSTDFPSLLGLTGMSQAGNDSQAVVQYLQSREPLEELENKISLRSRFQGDAIDWWSRLSPTQSIEGYVRYWRSLLDAYYETTTGTIIVRVTAFSPQDALAIATNCLTLSENLVNRMSARTRGDTLSFAEQEVATAEARLNDINARLRDLRDRDKMLDPRKAAESTMLLAAKITDEISQLNTELAQQRNSLSETAPSVRVNEEKLSALQAELEKVNAQITASSSSSRPLTSVIGAFDQLESESAFAEKAYQSALAALETARMDANRQQIYLATIVRPALPQEPSFPRPVKDTFLVFGAALTLWAIGLLVVQAVREHI